MNIWKHGLCNAKRIRCCVPHSLSRGKTQWVPVGGLVQWALRSETGYNTSSFPPLERNHKGFPQRAMRALDEGQCLWEWDVDERGGDMLCDYLFLWYMFTRTGRRLGPNRIGWFLFQLMFSALSLPSHTIPRLKQGPRWSGSFLRVLQLRGIFHIPQSKKKTTRPTHNPSSMVFDFLPLATNISNQPSSLALQILLLVASVFGACLLQPPCTTLCDRTGHWQGQLVGYTKFGLYRASSVFDYSTCVCIELSMIHKTLLSCSTARFSS